MVTSKQTADTLENTIYPPIYGDREPVHRTTKKAPAGLPQKTKRKQIQLKKKALTRGFKRK